METQERKQEDRKAPTLAETPALAERLAKHECFSPDWSHCPAWRSRTASPAAIRVPSARAVATAMHATAQAVLRRHPATGAKVNKGENSP